MTIQEALTKAQSMITEATESPRLDAELLLEHTLGKPRTFFYSHPEYELSDEVYGAFFALVEKRAIHYPLAYLWGYALFYGREVKVDERVLIPRPETEKLVELALEKAKELRVKDPHNKLIIADVCTGSGCVGISIALELLKIHESNFQVILSDISSEALEVAEINVSELMGEDRGKHVKVIKSDLLARHKAENLQIDILVANPPYVSQQEYDHLEKQIKDYEPELALNSGVTNLEIIKKLVLESKEMRIDKNNTFIEGVNGKIQQL